MKFLLATDMDGTVIPLEDTPERRQAIADFNDLVKGTPMTLAYVTGRHLELALDGVAQWGLPTPDAMVCDVGTTVYWRQGDQYVADPEYSALMKQRMGGFTGEDVQETLKAITELRLQEPERLSDFKTSYYVPLELAGDALTQRVHGVLAEKGITSNVVFSMDPHEDVGLIDVLPADVAKNVALEYLHQHSGLPLTKVVYSGDSGNDLKAFLSGYQAVAVANTPDWVKDEIRNATNCQVYISSNPSTAGVIEGCRHWGLFS